MSVVAGDAPEVLTPTRVTAGRPPAWPSGETVHRLGETTDTLLLRHLRTTTTEIPRRERRPLTGRKAGALTPRTR